MALGEIHPREFWARQGAGETLFLLDVREPEEVAEWAFPGAVNIPLGQLGNRTEELPADQVIVVACRSGNRSAVAAQALSRAGWKTHNLTGGALEWCACEERVPGS